MEIIVPKPAVETTIERVDYHEFGNIALAKRCADLLNEHYPNHLWAVHLNEDKTGGVLTIRDLAVSSIYGYVLHLSRVYHDPTLKCVLMAGGEILERANMIRGPWNFEFPKHVEGLPAKYQPLPNTVI